jgi:hypothetical protein
MLDAHGRLDLGDQGIDEIDIAGRADLRDEDGVEAVTRLLDHLDDIAIHVMRV